VQYGQHTALVEEVLAFAFSGRVLFATGPATDVEDAWITNDLRLAVIANAGDEAISRFQMAPDVDVSAWGNTDLLTHNLARLADLTLSEAEGDLGWSWHDLMENLVAELIWTSEWHQDREQQRYHDLLYARFIESAFETYLRRHLEGILPLTRPLEGWESCAEHLANNMVSELWYCAENRAANGLTDNFWERMFRLYKRGLWPCGWQGFFPRPGKFVAYCRTEAAR
jgi:hypothetical protein